MKKKGQIGEQFNWLFAAIAGAVILMFFIFVIVQVRGASEAKLAATVLNNFDGIITGSLSAPNTVSVIESSRALEFDISCEADGSSEMSVPKSRSKIDVSDKIIFAPRQIKGDQIATYVLQIEVPFYVGNALLMADSETFFIVIDRDQNDPVMQSLYESIPDNFTKSYSPTLELDKFKGFEKLIIAMNSDDFNTLTQNEIRRLLNSDASMVLYKDGLVDNIIASNDRRVAAFEGTERVIPEYNTEIYSLMALFSPNFEYFQCNIEKIITKARLVAQINERRAQKLVQTPRREDCRIIYESAENAFGTMASTATADPLSSTAASELQSLNDNLEKRSCPLLY